MVKEIIVIDKESEAYPDSLRQISNAPKKLYCKGDLSLLKESCVGVVGSRRYSLYGQQTATMIGRYLGRNNIVTVSGLANGIDSFAHTGALNEDGKTIAVLGTGFGRIYPKRNQSLYEKITNKGLVITEYEPEFKGNKFSFPARNRIISGLCEGVIVVEAGVASGALITAQFANEQGRNVYAVPGNINSQFSMGTNLLIRDGAIPLVVLNDLMRDIGKEPIDLEERNVPLGDDEREIIRIVEKNDGIHVNEIAHILNKNIGKVSAIITVLEIKGAIVSFGGKIHLAK